MKCPGSSSIIRPKPEYVICPNCGEEVEIWSDEVVGVCDNCGAEVRKSLDNVCINWCKYAEKCIGEDKYREIMSKNRKK